MKFTVCIRTAWKTKPVEQRSPKVVKRAGSMRFSKCGTFKGFKFDE